MPPDCNYFITKMFPCEMSQLRWLINETSPEVYGFKSQKFRDGGISETDRHSSQNLLHLPKLTFFKKNHFTDHSIMCLAVNDLKVQNSNSQSGCTLQSHR